MLEIILRRCSPVSDEASKSLSPGVSMVPGLTADAAVATGDERDLSFELSHVFFPSIL